MRSQLIATRAQFNTSDKVESGSGYIASADVDLLHGSLALGAGYRYRDGGVWTKQSYWVRGGLSSRPASVMLAWDVTTANRVRELELTTRADLGPVIVEYQLGPVSYVQAGRRQWGLRAALLLGLRR